MKPSIQQRRDEYHVTIATLLGCELGRPGGLYWRYAASKPTSSGLVYADEETPNGWSMAHPTAADAARAWLTENNHNLNGWQDEEARTHGEESNPAGN